MSRGGGHWRILAGLVAGVALGLAMRHVAGGAEVAWVARVDATCVFLGDLFMRALKMLIVPLVVTSLVAGVSALHGMKGFARMGLATLGFYLLSSLLAVVLGLVLVNAIQPGLVDGHANPVIQDAFARAGSGDARVAAAGAREARDFLEIFRAMLPNNVVAAATDNGQMLGVIVFSLLFAAAVTRLRADQANVVHGFFQAAADAMAVVTRWVMGFAPLGVFALIVPVVASAGVEVFVGLGRYFATVLAGLGIHFFMVLPLMLWVLGRTNPWRHLSAMRPALLLAFSTASSSGTLPVTMRCVEDGAGVPRKVSGFTLPLGATVNMDGTALYECVAVMFVAQVMGVHMGFGEQFFIVVAALLTSVGVAGIPSASLVAILLILKNSGIEGAEGAVAALLAVDRLLDMSRTAVNVYSDSCAAVVVNRVAGRELE